MNIESNAGERKMMEMSGDLHVEGIHKLGEANHHPIIKKKKKKKEELLLYWIQSTKNSVIVQGD